MFTYYTGYIGYIDTDARLTHIHDVHFLHFYIAARQLYTHIHVTDCTADTQYYIKSTSTYRVHRCMIKGYTFPTKSNKKWDQFTAVFYCT